MTELPSGTVTFLFTDMEGSTGLLKQLGEDYADLLAAHRTILREAFAASDGHEIDTQGDSFFVAFRRAKDAVAAAIEAQRGLASHQWPHDVKPRVRMGVHSGEPLVQPKSYVGLGVHRAARIMAAAHGGQILISNATRELIEDDLGPDVSLRDLDEHRLKDVDRPQRLFQVVAEGLTTEFPPVRSQTAETAYSGLEEELAAAAHAAVARRPRGPRRLLPAAVLAAVLAAAVTTFVLVLGWGNAAKAQPHVEPNSAVALDPGSGRVLASVSVGSGPVRATSGAGGLWVANANAGTVSRIDPATKAVTQTIDVGSGPAGIAFGGGSVWVTNAIDGTLSRIDARTSRTVQTVDGLQGPRGVAYGEGGVWVASLDDHSVLRVDPMTGLIVRTIATGGTPTAIAVGAGFVWVTNESGSDVLKLNPRTNAVEQQVNVGNGPSAIAVGLGSVWVANTLDGTVSRIDAETGTPTGLVRVGEGPRDIAVARGAVWVVSEFGGTVARVDPRSMRVISSTRVGNRTTGIAVGRAGVWVTVRPAGVAHRGGTFTFAVETSGIDSLDPAMAYNVEDLQLLGLSGDGLTGFRRVGGSEGATVVADLATGLPTPTDAGKTYTFALRPNIRYSTGALVKPADIRFALERDFELGSPGAGYYAKVLGASECRKGTRCDLARGIVASGHSIVFHLTAPEPEFPQRLALPFAFAVPTTSPHAVPSTRPLPATGPYVIARDTPKELRLVRNPHFHVWSQAARPDGYPDAIVMKIGLSRDASTTAVERGRLDYAPDLPPDRIDEVVTRYPAQVHTSPLFQTNALIMNTRGAPFSSVDARRAVSYALDRREMIRRGSDPRLAQPTCQILPRNFPGYVPYCPFSANATKAGVWLGPELARARKLIARSGTRGSRVTLLAETGRPSTNTAKYIVHLLDQLGYRASYKAFSYRQLSMAPAFSGHYGAAQIVMSSWLADYPSAASFLQPALSCGSTVNDSGFCDPTIDAEMRHAQALSITDSREADAQWARIDHQLTDAAAWIPFMSPKQLDFVSTRVGNFQFHPQWLVLFDQLWVR